MYLGTLHQHTQQQTKHAPTEAIQTAEPHADNDNHSSGNVTLHNARDGEERSLLQMTGRTETERVQAPNEQEQTLWLCSGADKGRSHISPVKVSMFLGLKTLYPF